MSASGYMQDSERKLIQLESRIKQLQAQNQLLSEQVKQLVKTESELHCFQDKLDNQVHIYRQLYEVGKKFNATFSVKEILKLVTHFVIYELNFERCIILRCNEEEQALQAEIWDGYYEESAPEKLDNLHLPLIDRELVTLLASNEYITFTPENYRTQLKTFALQSFRKCLGLDEYILFTLAGEAQQPKLLLFAGNSASKSQYQSSVRTDSDYILGLANLVSQATNAINQAQLYSQVRSKAEELEYALSRLQDAQAQLIQTEKMSSLGQLVGGLAHEINNPVNFIYGNLAHAKDYFQDLLNLIHLYQQESPQAHPLIQTKLREIDLNFLEEDLSKLLASMKNGAVRIRDIVSSLRKFCGAEETLLKNININTQIDSTLTLLKGRLQSNPHCRTIHLIKNYGELPSIDCYASQINQVFVHVLNNAIDALEEEFSPGEKLGNHRPTIWIHTASLSNKVIIRIIDNGPGMPETVKRRIFDPFFTTKTVGKGTGISMAICFQIISQRHKGSIKCFSSPGAGAEVVIELPYRQAGMPPVAQDQ